MKGKICFFIGHRDTPEGIYPALCTAVEEHILHRAVTEFVVGRYGSFDRLAAEAVKEAKERHPHVTLTLLLPYHPGERQVVLPQGFDGSYYPPGMERTPRQAAIVRANRYLVDHGDFLVAYACRPASNARNLVEYAQKRVRQGRLVVTNLGDLRER